ncbi:MAG TPA: dihydroorotase [Gemmatimonadota bacterium]|nr:dihydroorotase [Gemmatimonadota bacterium]
MDPLEGRDGIADVLLRNGRVERVEDSIADAGGVEVVDLTGMLLTPGLVDVHVHLREPGQEEKETIATGTSAAAAGGFVAICAMPNTRPVVDNPELVRLVTERAVESSFVRVHPIAAATLGSRGEQPTDVEALAAAGAVAISDDGRPISDDTLAEVLRRARVAGIPVADHCESLERSAGGAILEGPLARRLGVGGIPPEAESDAVARDLEVLARIGGRLHVCHVSTARSVELIRQAKADGLPVTAEVTPHHLILTVAQVEESGAHAKMNPPLAGFEDREAVQAALADGTIDCVATDHAPHTEAEKLRGLGDAPFGIIGLETAFALLYSELVAAGILPLGTLVRRLSADPARALGIRAPAVRPGERGDLAAFDLETEWTVDPARFHSRARNTPFAGWRLRGRPVYTVADGRVAYDGRRIERS